MYVVAAGYAFINKGIVYKEGDEITEKAFASHEAFVRAVSKKKIVVGKPKEQIEKEAAEAAEKAKLDAAKAAETEKAKEKTAAREKKETAQTAVNAAKETLAAAEKARDAAHEAEANAKEEAGAAGKALIERRATNKELSGAYDVLVKAGDKLKSAKKPAEKTAAEGELAKAKADFAMKENEDAEYKALAAARAAADAAAEKAETESTEAEAKVLAAKDALTLAEAELEKASAELAALEGK